MRGGAFGGGRGVAMGELERARLGQIGQAQESAFRGFTIIPSWSTTTSTNTNKCSQARQAQQQQDYKFSSTGGLKEV